MTDNPITLLYDALACGDIAAARACFTADARIWHSFDGIALDLDAAVQGWEALIAHSVERYVEDAHCQTLPDGFVQQHVFVLRTASGARKAWPVCVLVEVEAGRIRRFNEYMDRAGSFMPPEGAVKMPGF